MRSVGQWEPKIGWNLSKHELHQITSVNINAIKLFKTRRWDAGLRSRKEHVECQDLQNIKSKRN